MTSIEKIAYIKGMIDGMDFEFEGENGRIMQAMLDLLETMAAEITDLREELNYTATELSIINDDLVRVEDRLYGNLASADDSEFEDDDEEEEDHCGCGHDHGHGHHHHHGYDFFVVCPACGERLGLTQEDLEKGSINCPGCDENLEFDFDEDDLEHDHHHSHDEDGSDRD